MRLVASLAGIAAALALQTTLASFVGGSSAALDFVLIVVVYLALTMGPSAGLVFGCIAGLVQDSLSSGVLGIGGLAKTIVGYLAGVIGTQFIVTAPLPRFLVFVMATAVHAGIFMGLYSLLGLRQFSSPYGEVLRQGFANAVVGVILALVIEWFPGFNARRRASRPIRR